jgi:hypothetical protein
LIIFLIEDEAHGEQDGLFPTRQEAIAELERRATIPWDVAPNRAPCTGWLKCGRRYEVVEYDASTLPWREISRKMMLKISAAGSSWITNE